MTAPTHVQSWRLLQGIAMLVLVLLGVDLALRSERALGLLWNSDK